MDRYCPECNSNMTPSLVGYLCPDCGHMQRFYTMSGTQLQKTSIPLPKSISGVDDSPIRKPEDTLKSQSAASVASTTSNSGDVKGNVRSMLKRLMVPELPPPHSHGGPAKIATTTKPSEASTSVFENYDDLLDTAIKDTEPINYSPAPLPEEMPNQASASNQQTEATGHKHIPLWIWLVSAFIIFISTALILLLLIIT